MVEGWGNYREDSLTIPSEGYSATHRQCPTEKAEIMMMADPLAESLYSPYTQMA